MSERHRRRERYPDEPYGGERGRERPDWTRDRPQYYGEPSRAGQSVDRGYNRGDYRGDFGPEGERRWQKPGHARDSYERDDAGWSGRGEWGQRGGEGWERGRRGGGGFGSEYGAWRSGASFGFGPEEHPEGGFEDTDWAPNRPARGRGTWAGDWSVGRVPEDRSAGPQRTGGSSYMREDFRGRGPRDYRRADDRIRDEVCDRLTDDPYVDAADISIRVEGGEVTLSGTVASREQKRRAEDCVERVTGVREVINQIRVNRGDLSAAASTGTTTGAGTGSGATRSQRAGAGQTPGVAADRERQS
jgi:hypothetical protein